MSIQKWHLAEIIFTIIAGTLDHFIYQWSGESIILAPFSAVNESTWEHLKLLAVPMLLLSLVGYFTYGKAFSNYLAARTFCVLAGMTSIIVMFYGCVALTGQHWLWADIAIFILSVISAYVLSFFLLKHNLLAGMGWELTARVLLTFLIVSFVYFTGQPPHVFLFQDPITGHYGM